MKKRETINVRVNVANNGKIILNKQDILAYIERKHFKLIKKEGK